VKPKCLKCGAELTVEAAYSYVCNTCREHFWKGFGLWLL